MISKSKFKWRNRQNEEHRQMKIKNEMEIQKWNEDTKMKWRTTTKHLAGSFWLFDLKKNGYRSVIDITFISDIVLHMVLISTFNKGNGWCWKYIKRWWIFWWCCWYTKKRIEQNKKRECLKSVIDKGKVHLLGHKWTHGRMDKASDETINKIYVEYKQRELNEKGENTGKSLGKHVINL